MGDHLEEKAYFKKLTPETFLKPDPPFLKTAPITVEEFFTLVLSLPNGSNLNLPEAHVPLDGWLATVNKIQLVPGTPRDVARLFEAAKGMFAYGYLYYPLCTLASEQLLRVLECAISAKCSALPNCPKPKAPLKAKIDWMVSEGVIRTEDRDGLTPLRTLRNSTSHPAHQMLVPPQLVGQTFKDVAAFINKLFDNNGTK